MIGDPRGDCRIGGLQSGIFVLRGQGGEKQFSQRQFRDEDKECIPRPAVFVSKCILVNL